MDEAEQDQHEARLKEMFNSFDATGTGSLGQEELIDLCQLLNLEEVTPALQQTLFWDNLLGRVYFDQFKEALILVLSRTLSFEEHLEEPDFLPEVQPKYIKDGKCYGRRSLPEFQKPLGKCAEVRVLESLNEEAQSSLTTASDYNEYHKTQHSEEYEAEGQLRFWNSDDLNASQRGSSPTQDWIDDKLHEVCEDLGMTQDGHLNKKKLISICEYHGLKNVNKEVFEDIFHDLKPDGTMNMKDFFYSLFKNGKPLTTSASTPYRQVKRHLSMPSFDESGRRTITSSAITSSITFRLFSCLDDGMGYGSVEQILDIWNEEGIENGQEILKALDFSLDGSINLMELTLALENELLITKNGMHQAVLASFKTEIRHLLEQIDQVAREKEKLQSDIEKAEKLKSLLASEVDDHHAAIERQYEYNLRKLEEVYKEKITSFKNDNQKEREQILQQAGKQHLELEQEIEKVKTEENYIRDRLTFSLKFHDLDPNIAEFFLQEERLTQMKTEYERRCRILQDQVDELQSELEEYRAQGKVFKLPFKKSLSQELDVRHHSTDLDQGFGSENCNPLNMSIEAELIIEQLKEQHHRDMKCLTLELKDKMLNYEKQLDETKVNCEKEQENVKQKYKNEIHTLEKQISALKSENAQLQKQTAILKKEQQETDCRYVIEKNELQVKLNEEKAHLQEKLKLEHEVALKNRLQQVEESFNREREGLIQNVTWAEEKMRDLVKAKEEEKCKLEEFYQEQLKSLMEKHTLEKEELQRKLLEKLQNKLQEERNKMEIECNRRNSQIEAHFLNECQKVPSKYEDSLINLKDSYQQELKDLKEQQHEEKSKWESEKDELIQEYAEAQEQLKQTLKHEKAKFLALTKQQEILEKKYEEHLISLVSEKQQLQKHLEELRNVSESQQNQLSEQIFELKNSHEKEFKDREHFVSQVDNTGKLDRQKLEEQEIKCECEKEDIASQFLAMEDFNKKICKKADREKVELRLQISRLQNKIKELQHGIPTKPQNSSQVATNENADMASEMSLLQQGTELLEENGDILINLQQAHEKVVKENVKMAAEIIRLHQRLQKLDSGSEPLASVEESNDLIRTSLEQTEILSSQNRIKQVEGIITHILCESPDDSVQEVERIEISSFQTLETKMQESLGSLERFSEFENNEVTSTESLDLKNKFLHLQGRLKVLQTECDQTSENKQDLIFDVSKLKEKIKVLESNPEAIAKYRMLYENANRENYSLQEELKKVETQYNKEMENNRDLTSEVFRLRAELKKVETVTEAFLRIKQRYDEVKVENEDLKTLVLRPGEKTGKLQERSVEQCECFSLSQVGLDTQELKAEKKILGQNKKLEQWGEKFVNLKSVFKECNQENVTCEQEDKWVLEKTKVSEDFWLQGKMNSEEKSTGQTKLKTFEEDAVFSDLQGKYHHNDTRITELESEKNKLQELTRQLREKVTNLVKQKHLPSHGEKEEEFKSMMYDLQSTCSEMQQKVELLRQESEKCQEENSILRKEITTLNEEGSISYLKLRELRGSQEEIWKKIETVRKEKIAIQKMVENFKKQVSELKTKNQHLDLKNANVIQKNTQNEADIRYLQHLAQILCQKEKEIGNSTLEEWGKQSSRLKEELDNCKAKSAKLSFLESKIATMKLEQKSWEDQNETLKSQLAASQEKVQNLDDCLQNANIQISQMNSDLQVTQQKNEALKQEVMSLQKQLKNVNGKNWLPERAICPSGLQDQLSWHKLDHPINQELELLMEENARLQIVVQNSTTEFMYSQEKVSQMNKLEEELETIHLENQSLKNKQVKVDEEMMEGSQKQLVIAMEERMLEVERKLKLVKRLLQEKVNQLKQQLCKNTKSDAVMKDLYVENNHLLKTLEITEQRQKTAEKKNYLLEEKIASLSNIIRNLTPAPVISAPPLSS
ncbi:ninein isoform X2 [Trichosurus vulpecula]|uniref:ninein isoform X2 n=1 Tax=Trichosurus vulpecula TaxID=9337 RepID=UPI00186B57F9|nr:ninein isoform X2 [Trichosurus vulpecula]